jgi:hypothetical protein
VNLYICRLDLELRQLFLLILSIATVIVWFVFRKENWSWILQVTKSFLQFFQNYLICAAKKPFLCSLKILFAPDIGTWFQTIIAGTYFVDVAVVVSPHCCSLPMTFRKLIISVNTLKALQLHSDRILSL